jgi:hypothetical protein
MATKYLDSTATGTGSGNDWDNAYTSIVTAASDMAIGDNLRISHTTATETLSVQTITFPGDNQVVSVDKNTGNRTKMTNKFRRELSITIQTASDQVLWLSGIRVAIEDVSTSHTMQIGTTRNKIILHDVDLILATSNVNSRVRLGPNVNAARAIVEAHKLNLFFGAVSQGLVPLANHVDINEMKLLDGSVTPTNLLKEFGNTSGSIRIRNSDLGDMYSDSFCLNPFSAMMFLANCKISGASTLASYTVQQVVCGDIYGYDCAVGDSHVNMLYVSPLGAMQVDTGKYADDNIGEANLSWKITTTALASQGNPLVCPLISRRHRTTGSVTPWFAIAREDSASAFTNGEVWADFSAKETDASVIMTVKSDKAVDLATPANQTTDGDTSWTGLGGTNWKGKVGEQAFTVAEHGFIQGQLYVGLANAELRLDPQVRI